MITPDDIETWHCQSCLRVLKDYDLPREEPCGCPYCRNPLLLPIDQHERNRRIDETHTAWCLAVRDGLIRPQAVA